MVIGISMPTADNRAATAKLDAEAAGGDNDEAATRAGVPDVGGEDGIVPVGEAKGVTAKCDIKKRRATTAPTIPMPPLILSVF